MKFRLIILSLLVLFIFACEDSTCPDVVMTAPTNLSLTQLDWSSIQLTWQDNTSSETHYQIDRKIGDGIWATSYQILTENSASFVDSNLTEIGNYTYRVLAYNNEESSGFTEASYHFVYDEVQAIYPAVEDLVFIYPEETIEYQIHLVDALNELVEHDYEVWFKLISAPEGADINGILVDELDSLSVNSLAGIATVYLTAGSIEGEIQFQAYTKNSINEKITADLTAYVDHQYPEVAEIQILNTEQIVLGANDTVAIHLNLLDEEGNIVQQEYEVYVELLSGPEGFNINNEAYEIGEYVTIPTVSGQTVFSVNSGVVSGAASIRVYTYNSIEEISVEMNNILVLASAPSYCELYSGGVDEGEDLGNGIWRIPLNAYLTDIEGNPVQDGTSVLFTLPNNPLSATIETEYAFVGNINDPEPGFAYNSLTYDGAFTNDTIIVRIQTADFTQDYEVILPLQFGELQAMPVPGHFEWTENIDPEYTDIEIRIMMSDIQNNNINGQVLEFSTTHGTPLESSPPDTGDPWSGITGVGTLPPYEGENGILYKYIRVYKDELPAPNPDPEPVQVFILVNLLGIDISTEVIVTLTRTFD